MKKILISFICILLWIGNLYPQELAFTPIQIDYSIKTENLSYDAIAYCEEGIQVFDHPDDYKPIDNLSKGDEVNILDINGDYYKVCYSGGSGYVLQTGFESNDEIIMAKRPISSLNANSKSERIAVEKRRKKMIKKYGRNDGMKINKKYVWRGITKKMIIESWGKPSEIKKITKDHITQERWIYGTNKLLILENGKLISWKN